MLFINKRFFRSSRPEVNILIRSSITYWSRGDPEWSRLNVGTDDFRFKLRQVSKSFRNFAVCDGELTPSRQKKELILLFCTRLFVTLHR